jgi:hypothetical protein
MNTTEKTKIYSAAILLLLLTACEPTDFENIGIDHDPTIAVYGMVFQGDSSMHISLSKSSGLTDTVLFEDLKLNIDNSNLTLMTPDQGLVEGYVSQQSASRNGIRIPLWSFDYTDFVAGEEYELMASTSGLDPVSASITIPPQPTLIAATLDEINQESAIVVRDRFEITLQDPSEEENYYYIKAVEIIDESGFEFESDYRFYDLPSNPIDISYLEKVITSFSDRDFNGREHTMVVYGERVKRTRKRVEFRLYQITKEHYDYIQIYERYNSDSPIDEPVLLNSNVEGGQGIFAVTSKPDIITIE